MEFLREEITEFEEARARHDLAYQVDSMIDLIYVALGTLLEMGVNPKEPFHVVHDANMKKIRGETRRADSGGYDAIKPEGWTPPDIDAVLARQQILEQISHVHIELTQMRIHKGTNYNRGTVKREEHFPLGHESYFQMVWVKAIRLRSLVESLRLGADVIETTRLIRRELPDLLNYGTFWVENIDKRGEEK